MWHFYQYGPTLSDGLLHIINFCAPIVHFIKLETWFYANSLFKYDLFCFYSPQMSLLSVFGSREVKILKAPSLCYFYQYRSYLSDGVFHIKNFGAHIVHFIRLEK